MKKLIALAKVACKSPHVVFQFRKRFPERRLLSFPFNQSPYKSNLLQWGKSILRSIPTSESEYPSIVVFRGLEPLSIWYGNERRLLQDWKFLRYGLLTLRDPCCLTIILRLQRRMNNGKKSTMLGQTQTIGVSQIRTRYLRQGRKEKGLGRRINSRLQVGRSGVKKPVDEQESVRWG